MHPFLFQLGRRVLAVAWNRPGYLWRIPLLPGERIRYLSLGSSTSRLSRILELVLSPAKPWRLGKKTTSGRMLHDSSSDRPPRCQRSECKELQQVKYTSTAMIHKDTGDGTMNTRCRVASFRIRSVLPMLLPIGFTGKCMSPTHLHYTNAIHITGHTQA